MFLTFDVPDESSGSPSLVRRSALTFARLTLCVERPRSPLCGDDQLLEPTTARYPRPAISAERKWRRSTQSVKRRSVGFCRPGRQGRLRGVSCLITTPPLFSLYRPNDHREQGHLRL